MDGVLLNNPVHPSYFVIRMPQTRVLFVIRKLLSISHALKLYEIRITKPMVEEGGLRITNNKGRDKHG